jgi:ABC-type multidrug transport system fused ATPase/permease subunit
MKKLLLFIFNKLEKKTLSQFVLCGIFVFIMMGANLLVPLLQRQLLENASKGIWSKVSLTLNILAGLIGAILSITVALISNKMSMDFKHKLEFEMLESVTKVPSKRIDMKGAGAYMVNILGDAENLSDYFNPSYFIFIFSIINVISVIVISMKWTLALVFVVPILYIICIIILVISSRYHVKYFALARDKVMELNPFLLSFIQNRRSIMRFSDASILEDYISEQMLERDKMKKKAFAFTTFSKSAIDVIKSIGLIVFICLVAFDVKQNKTNLPTLVALIGYFAQAFIPLSTIQEILSQNSRFDMLYKRAPLDIKQNINQISIPTDNTQSLKFDNCSFSYEENQNTIKTITDFSLNISNKLYEVVGLSGEGKSTIIKLITGEENPGVGECSIMGVPISNIPQPILYSLLNIYSQDVEIFNEDLNFNICLMKKPYSNDQYHEELINKKNEFNKLINDIINEPAKKINRHNKQIKEFFAILNIMRSRRITLTDINDIKSIINNEQDKIASILASTFMSQRYYIIDIYNKIINDLEIDYLNGRKLGENGKSISGGEKQKISLARFLLKNNTNISIIDEPFTNLDVLSEAKCIDVLKQYLKGHSGIIISHKLNIISSLSDEIIVINDSRIIEKGSHEKLKNNGGLYQQLYSEFVSQRKE